MPKTHKKSEAEKCVHNGHQNSNASLRFQTHLALEARGYGVMGSQGGRGTRVQQGTPAPAARVPIGWERVIEDGTVEYISPSGTVLCSVDEVRAYLSTDGTCKCGLECPLVLHKVFCFDPRVEVLEQGQEPWKLGQDMTKLCNHRRKAVAMAALRRSMQVSQQALPGRCSGSGPDCRDPGGVSLRGQEVKEHTPYSAGPKPSSHPRHNNSPSPAPCQGNISSPQLSISAPSNRSLPPSHLLTNSHWSPEIPQKSALPNPAPFSYHGSSQGFPRPPTSPNFTHQNQRPPHTLESHSSPWLRPQAWECQSKGGSTASPPPHLQPSSSVTPPSDLGTAVYHRGSKSRSSCPTISPLPLTVPRGSPKIPLSSGSPKEGESIFQKEFGRGSTACSAQTCTPQKNQSNFRVPSPRGPKAVGLTLGTGAGGCSGLQGHQKHTTTFPASNLLSAAAKARLANQNQTQNQGNDSNAGYKEVHQTKVIMSTLPNSHSLAQKSHSQSQNRQSLIHNRLAALQNSHTPSQISHSLLQNNHSPSSLVLHNSHSPLQNALPASIRVPTTVSPQPCFSPAPPPTAEVPPLVPPEKASSVRWQCRSPMMLSTPKKPQLSALSGSLSSSPSTSSSTSELLHPPQENHLPLSVLQPSLLSGPSHDQKTSPASVPPLSALLHMLSMQSAQAAAQDPPVTSKHSHAHPSSLGLPIVRPVQSQPKSQPPSPKVSHLPPQTQCPTSLTEAPPMPPTPPITVPNPSNSLTYRPCHTHTSITSPAVFLPEPEDLSRHAPGSGADSTRVPAEHQIHVTSGLFQTEDDHCPSKNPDDHIPVPSPHPPAPTTKDTSNITPCDTPNDTPGDAPVPLQLAESFPFMTQEQLLQLLSAAPGLPSLLAQPLLGSLPIGVWVGGQAGQTPPPQQVQPSLLNPDSQPDSLHSVLETQEDLPVNFVGVFNPPTPAVATADPALSTALSSGLPPAPPTDPVPGPAPGPAPSPVVDLYEKPSLQALLLASLLLSQQAAPIMPIPGLEPLNMDQLLQQQQLQFPPVLEGGTVEKDSLLSAPGVLEALQGVIPQQKALAGCCQPHILPPAPSGDSWKLVPRFSLNGWLSFRAIWSVCELIQPGQKPCPSCPSDALHVCPWSPGRPGGSEQYRWIPQSHGAGPLLLPAVPTPGLGMPLIQGHGASLNPLTCLLNSIQLNLDPSLAQAKKSKLVSRNRPAPPPMRRVQPIS
ncbi:hypothetical protein AGOR_G00133250 [Albula goreensis]|uniref:MBD domain-containing protein n=1 Tax=Albula goreensis TaxID=1534307 RepID=A0A8T3DC17_9TELE|nr:hypothetical protein AGOR_G00133250 [Albula goreensis]